MKKRIFSMLAILAIALSVGACDVNGAQNINEWTPCNPFNDQTCEDWQRCINDTSGDEPKPHCVVGCSVEIEANPDGVGYRRLNDTCQRNGDTGMFCNPSIGYCQDYDSDPNGNNGGDTDYEPDPNPNPSGDVVWCRFYIPSNVNASTLIGDDVVAVWYGGGPVDSQNRSIAEYVNLEEWNDFSLSGLCLWDLYQGAHPYLRYNLVNCNQTQGCVPTSWGDGDQLVIQCDLSGNIIKHVRGLGQTDAELPYVCGL